MWDLWIFTNNRIRLFVARYASQNEARFFKYAWWERGFFPVKHDGPPSAEITVPNHSILFAFITPAVGAVPTQVISPSRTTWMN